MKISFIIVEYKDTEVLQQAIDSILQHSASLLYEIIVASNSCYDAETQNAISAKYPSAVFIYNQGNYGFGKAVNQGINRSSGSHVVLINPDAKLIDQSICNAIEFMEQSPKVGIVGPAIIDRDLNLQDSCRDFISLKSLAIRFFKRAIGIAKGPVLEKKELQRPQEADWVSGACMLVKKEAIDQVGLLDERYFMYAEDMDWCRRFKVAGWGVVFYSGWRVEHNATRGSTSGVSLTNKLMWIHLSSIIKYFIKWSWIGIWGRPRAAKQKDQG